MQYRTEVAYYDLRIAGRRWWVTRGKAVEDNTDIHILMNWPAYTYKFDDTCTLYSPFASGLSWILRDCYTFQTWNVKGRKLA